MRNILLAIMVGLLPASVVLAEPSKGPKLSRQSAAEDRLLPAKGARAGNSCSAYGPGFVKIDGTETCIKLGGGIGIETGGSVR